MTKFQAIFSQFKQKSKTINSRDVLVGLLIVFFSGWLMTSTFGYHSGKMFIASKAWSDFGAHLPLIRSFSQGDNLPPQYPQFAGPSIKYHYLFYFIVGLVERLGFNIAFSLNAISAVGMGLFLWMFYQTAKLIIGKRSGAILALYLFLFNGSLTFISFFQENWTEGNLLESWLTLKEFANFGPWNGDSISAFWNWNIYTNQRHLGLSFGLILVLIWPLLKAVYQPIQAKTLPTLDLKKWIWIIWLGLILLPFLHQAGYVMTVIFILGWFLFNPSLIERYGLLYFLGLLYSVPGFFYFFEGSKSIGWQLGFLAKKTDIFSIINYWFYNLGAYFLIWPLLLLLADKKDRKLLLIFSSYFVLANLLKLSPDMINNHKLVNFYGVALVILTAKMLINWWQQAGKKGLDYLRTFIILFIVLISFSGWVDAMPIVNDHDLVVPDPQFEPVGVWIKENTSSDSVFVTSTYFYHPANLVGRKTFLDYGYFSWSLGYPDKQRRKYLPMIFAQETNVNQWCNLMTGIKVNYVSINLKGSNLDPVKPKQSWLFKTQLPIKQTIDGFRIYSVTNICQSNF
ncbi:MAG: hypothetical protein U9O78_04250 [Patescibacteria group bacterium]|nr:hypothetical protein [Patescibacteria group bacterium]